MARKPVIPDDLAKYAREKAKTADDAHELRKAQSILLPALFSLDLVATGTVLGRSRASVCRLQAEFKADCTGNQIGPKKRGGRRRQNISADQEAQFLAPFFQKAREGIPIVVAEIQQAYETAIGKKVPASTIYRLLARHGWSPLPAGQTPRDIKQKP
jgi:transposase